MINRQGPGAGAGGAAAQRRQPGGWMGIGGPPPAKLNAPAKTLRQLLGRLRPDLPLIAVVAVLGIGSVAFSVIGPKIIGNATDIIFNGIVGKMLPAGITKAQAIALLQAHGQGQIAQMLSGMDVTPVIARRSQRQFAAQWKWTGSLNGHVEETHTGHMLVQVFGRRNQAQETFEQHNRGLYEASFRAQFLSGIIQPAIQFLANLNYVAVAVIGAYRVASGTMTLGDVQAFIQYSRQFTMPIMQIAGQMNLLQSGLASAERVFELLDA